MQLLHNSAQLELHNNNNKNQKKCLMKLLLRLSPFPFPLPLVVPSSTKGSKSLATVARPSHGLSSLHAHSHWRTDRYRARLRERVGVEGSVGNSDWVTNTCDQQPESPIEYHRNRNTTYVQKFVRLIKFDSAVATGTAQGCDSGQEEVDPEWVEHWSRRQVRDQWQMPQV